MTATVRTTGIDAGSADLAVVIEPAPDRRPRRRAGRHLRPVEKPTKRRSPAVPVVVGAGIVIVALFALAAMHALLIGGQLRLDDLRREQASESEQVRQLRLEVAELEAPDRVLDVARDRLGMVDPGEVGYLLPVGVAGGDEGPVRVDPATTPPPPPPPVEESVSPEQAEVDAGSLTGPPLAEGAETPDGSTSDSTDSTVTADSPTTATPSEGAPDGGTE
ncbi:FtsB family cell division protein [Actinospongicola halichondriae]|uniref:FtsB family cell division protein n=1 Tax=Actinospongicola halichondriae TaxID=3236844 RepID=UPI003D3DFFEA